MLFNLPLDLPVAVIAVLFLIFYFVPLISNRIKIPSIILLIIIGIIVGPNGLNIINIDKSINMLSDLGIMFIMFLAGIELNANQIKSNKKNSIIFGILVFVFPFSIGFTLFHFILSYSFTTSILVALMFSTQTLVSFPTISHLGLGNNRSVITAIGGTIITDATVLFSMGLLIAAHNGILDSNYLFKFFGFILIFIVLVAVIFPFIVKSFFKRYEGNNYSQFSLIMALLFLSGAIAHLAGLESIIGAFFAGVMLNRYIPKNSALMQYLHFTGNAIFIPIFLFYVGMLIDYRLVIYSSETIIISIILTIASVIAKLVSAYISGKILHFTKDEIGLLFGLSASQAAVVIATALIGYNMGIIHIDLLNAAVVLILVSCITSSYVSEYYGKKIVITEQALKEEQEEHYDKVIVPYANPNTVDKLLDIAVATVYPNPLSIIYPLTVVIESDEQYKQTITLNKNKINEIAQKLYSKEINFTPISRIDVNYVAGIDRAAKELLASMIVIGWTGKLRKSEVLGKNIDAILARTDIQIMVCHILEPINIFNEIIVVVPEYAQYEKGFKKWMHSIDSISKNIGAKITFVCQNEIHLTLKQSSEEWKINTNANFVIKDSFIDIIEYLDKSSKNTLTFFVFARYKSVSEVENIINFMRDGELSKQKENKNFVFLIPEQFSSDNLPNNSMQI